MSEIVHSQIPDVDGNLVPLTVHEGSAEISGSRGETEQIMVGIAAGTYNVQKATCGNPCNTCNGIAETELELETFGVTVGGTTTESLIATFNTGSKQDYSSAATWSSYDTNILTLKNPGMATGVSPGSSYAHAITAEEFAAYDSCITSGQCPDEQVAATSPGTVISFKATGKSYIFVGTDPNELYGNHYTLTDSTGKQPPQPPGGTCCADSIDASDTVTQTGSNPPIFQFTTLDQSIVVGDRTLTFEYDLSGSPGASQQMSVTARKFAYVTNSSPSNACSLGYGTNRTYVYTLYTHPDGNAVLSTDGISGTAVAESFNPTLTCETITANGSLNANAQFDDDITSICSSKPLTCTQTSTQTISVAGYPVRTNKLQWTSKGVTYTSNCPTQ